MELTLYDPSGRPVAYCEDGRHLYGFDGTALAYLDGDSVYAFHGEHLGWWDRGWVRDHHGACALFAGDADDVGPVTPSKQPTPNKATKHPPRPPAYPLPRPDREPDTRVWALRSGRPFFPPPR